MFDSRKVWNILELLSPLRAARTLVIKEMVDWQGLFKWSLSYNDGTSNPDIKPMSDEDKKWLQEAIEAYSLDVPNRMKEIAKSL